MFPHDDNSWRSFLCVSSVHVGNTCGFTTQFLQFSACTLIIQMLKQEYSGVTRPKPWLSMPWPLASPGHQQPLYWLCPLRWRHNGRDSVSNHQPHECLLNRLFRRSSKKTPKLRVTGLCEGWIPAQRASNAEKYSIWWRHHANKWVLVFHEVGFQLPDPYQCWEIIENENIYVQHNEGSGMYFKFSDFQNKQWICQSLPVLPFGSPISSIHLLKRTVKSLI